MFGKNKLLQISIVLYVMEVVCVNPVAAALKDSDFDGVTDQAEVSIYQTDPLKFDTDGDGYGDGVEIVAKSNPLDAVSTPVTVSERKKLPLLESGDPITWYIARISGIAAFILLSSSVLFGLVQTSKALLKYRFMSIVTAMETHRAISWFGGLAVISHVTSLFFDTKFGLKLVEAAIPFNIGRTFTSSLGVEFKYAVALGIFAIYFIILLVATSELRTKIVSAKVWRAIHFISFLTYILFLAHGILSGSDTKEWWMISIYATSTALVLVALLARIFKKNLFLPKGVSNDQTRQSVS